MRRILFCGSWQNISGQVELDIIETISSLKSKGQCEFISGGAAGVDRISTREWLKYDSDAERTKIYLPTTLRTYSDYMLERMLERRISEEETTDLLWQLRQIQTRNPGAIIEGNFQEVNQRAYYSRIDDMVTDANEGYAFHINNSEGTQYTIDQMNATGKPMYVKKYKIPTDS